MARKGYSQPQDLGENQSVSISSRKIEGGYLISRSKSGPEGYECKESFTPTAPDLGVEAQENSGRPDSGNSLRSAIKSLKGR